MNECVVIGLAQSSRGRCYCKKETAFIFTQTFVEVFPAVLYRRQHMRTEVMCAIVHCLAGCCHSCHMHHWRCVRLYCEESPW